MKKLHSKEVAFLGIFTALIAALRPLGFGSIGIEPMWFALILASRLMGPYLGFLLGALGMFFSALLTGGFGPWLPGQIATASVIGLLTFVIPKSMSGRKEIFCLVAYSVFAAEFYGMVMDLIFWPIALGSNTQLSFNADLSLTTNALRFLSYHFIGALAWDVPRAIFTSTMIVIAGPTVLKAVRRALADPTMSGRVTLS